MNRFRMMLGLLLVLTLAGCGEQTPEGVAHVELTLYFGRPNPELDLSSPAELAMLAAVADRPDIAEPSDYYPDGLGYDIDLIDTSGLPDRIRVWNDIVEITEGDDVRYVAGDGIEDWLAGVAAEAGVSPIP